MPETMLQHVAEWGNFYVIIGSAAAGLTGLMFVVITLGADAGTVQSEEGLRAFVTPTLVHFGAALLVAAIMTSPGHTARTLGGSVGVVGILGLAYVAWVMVLAKRQEGYVPVTEDWLFHGLIPALVYAALIITAVLIHSARADTGLHVLAGVMLALLFAAIHNAWDTAVWVAVAVSKRRVKEKENEKERKEKEKKETEARDAREKGGEATE